MYTAFEQEPQPTKIDYCPCCMTAREIDKLLATPLRDVPKNIIGKYGGCAFYTVGDADEYHYFFPRLLEIVATDKGFWPDWEVVLAKLKLASWSSWNAAQKSSVVQIIDKCFDSLINESDCEGLNTIDIETMLTGIARSDLDLTPYLKKLENSQHKTEFKNFVVEISDYTPPKHAQDK